MALRELYAELFGEDLLFLDPAEQFDTCILGVAERCGLGPVVLYDADKVIQALVDEGMPEDDALEHFYHNIVGAYMGEKTPLFYTKVPDDHAAD